MSKVISNVAKLGFTAVVPALSYASNRKQGDGRIKSGAKAAFNFATIDLMAPVIATQAAAQGVIGGAKMIQEQGRKNAAQTSKAYGAYFGGDYKDNERTYTMRQRGIQAIQNNGLNTRSVLGSEARQYIRSGR